MGPGGRAAAADDPSIEWVQPGALPRERLAATPIPIPNPIRGEAMNLFDFAKDIGKKLFGNAAEASEKIKEEIERDNPGVKDLGVRFEDGTVTLSGSAESADAMEKAVLMAGNVAGVSRVEAAEVEAPAQTARVELYEIRKGDTLSAIAKRFYGNANAYPRVFEANREVIKDPDLIYPGQKIRIPLDPA
jgi:nucleoid-associated protein YgaU